MPILRTPERVQILCGGSSHAASRLFRPGAVASPRSVFSSPAAAWVRFTLNLGYEMHAIHPRPTEPAQVVPDVDKDCEVVANAITVAANLKPGRLVLRVWKPGLRLSIQRIGRTYEALCSEPEVRGPCRN